MPILGPPLAEDGFVPLHRILQKGLEAGPDEVAFASALTSKTWRQLENYSDYYARHLLSLGLKAGDRVASLMPNRVALLIHYLGCFKARLVAVPLNYRYMAPEIDHALEVSGASLLLAHGERDADLKKSKLVARLPLGCIRYQENGGGDFEPLLSDPAPKIELPTPLPEEPCLILFTSGSTGKPKGVTHSFETLGWALAIKIQGFEMTSKDVALPAASLSHSGGYCMGLAAWAAGARVVNARAFDANEILPLLRAHRPTLLLMLPAPLFSLAHTPGVRREDFASIRACISGGDKVSATLEQEFTRLTGFAINEIFGLTECNTFTANAVSGEIKIGSVGRPMPGISISIRDKAGRELPSGEAGRLWIKSPSLMVGYWDQPEETAKVLRNGWLDTGDLMRADEEGYLWFCGRRKQIIIHDGSNICPQEVEEALMEHEAVEAAGIIGVHDPVHGENVRAYITLRQDAGAPDLHQLIAFARERVGYKAPEEIVVLEEMPLNATGKTDRAALKRMAAGSVT